MKIENLFINSTTFIEKRYIRLDGVAKISSNEQGIDPEATYKFKRSPGKKSKFTEMLTEEMDNLGMSYEEIEQVLKKKH